MKNSRVNASYLDVVKMLHCDMLKLAYMQKQDKKKYFFVCNKENIMLRYAFEDKQGNKNSKEYQFIDINYIGEDKENNSIYELNSLNLGCEKFLNFFMYNKEAYNNAKFSNNFNFIRLCSKKGRANKNSFASVYEQELATITTDNLI